MRDLMQSNFPKLGGKAVDYEAVKRNAYHDQGIAIIDLTDSRIPWPDRELLIGMCERIYGKSKSGDVHSERAER